MQNIKRFLCIILAIVICCSLLPLNVFAASTIPYEGNNNGTIKVTAYDAVTNTPLEGASFQLEDITAGREQNYGVKTTGADGTVTWGSLSSGTYRVIQTAVPEGYVLDSETKSFFYNPATGVREVVFANKSEGTIYVHRIDPDTQAPLAGASYVVTDNKGATVASGMTDDDGVFIASNLPAGDYVVTEVAPPKGFAMSTPPAQKAVLTAAQTGPYKMIFSGSEQSSITIHNYDAATGGPIAGSRWKIERVGVGSQIYDNLVTGQDGMVTQTGLTAGTYQVTQVEVAPGYMNQTKSSTVVIGTATERRVVSLSNVKPGTITAYANDSVTGAPVPGIKFYLYDSQNTMDAGPYLSSTHGTASFEQVSDGHYSVMAESVEGYVLDMERQAVRIENGGDKYLYFTATPMGSLLIRAVSETAPGTPLAGAEFEIRKMNGTLVGSTYTTGPDGTVSVPNLENGQYVITQTKCPAGFVMESNTKTVSVKAGTVTPVTFSHRDRPYITVQANVSGTTTPVPNSTVSLVAPDGKTIMTGTTDGTGSYVFSDLQPGVYTVKYISAPDGYAIKTASQTVEVATIASGTAILYADLNSSIIVSKVDNRSNEPLAGATFLIRDSLGVSVGVIHTDVSGTAVSEPLEPGQYTIHEQFAPPGYVATTESRSVIVRNNESTLATFTNEKKSAVVVYAYDSNGQPMSNVPFVLFNAVTGAELATGNSNSAGVATFENVEPGVYMVAESVIPGGFIVVNPIQSRIVVTAGEAAYARFVHVPEAAIKMETVDIYTGEAVAGAVYQVISEDGSFEANFSTDANGEAVTQSLPLGKYTVKQIVAPEGYLLNTTTQTIDVLRDRLNLAKFFNKPISRIVVECVETGANFGLSGVTVTIEAENGKEVFRGTTTTGGTFTSGELEPGLYTVKVIAAPDGYACVQKERTVEVTLGEPTTVKFEFTSNNHIIVNLTDAAVPGKGLAGSTFRVEMVDGDFATDIVTDSSGKAMTDKLPNGKYMVHQTVAPEGYLLDQSYQWATLDATADTVLDFTNRRISGLTIQALTEDGHVGLAGATFEIWEQNGKLVKTVTTDASGVVTLDTLAPGVYVVKEVTVPQHYTARTLTQTVTITHDMPSTLNFYHVSEGILTVNKTDARTGKPLSGASFRITRANGDYVGDYTTDASGRIVISTLSAGTYHIAETKAPDGYLLDKTSRSFTIKNNTPLVLDISNEPLSSLRIVNTGAQDGSPIMGSRFKVQTHSGEPVGTYETNSAGLIDVSLEPGRYSVYQLSVPDGYKKNESVWNITVSAGKNTVLEVENQKLSGIAVQVVDAQTGLGIYGVQMELKDQNSNYLGRFSTDNEGRIHLSEAMAAGRYSLSLYAVPHNYDKDSIPRTIVVETGKTTEVVWKLQGHQGQLTIVTYSGEDNAMMNIRKHSPLPGAVYQLTDAAGRTVGTITGDVNGYAYSGPLTVGTYYVQQIAAPTGWQLNPTRFAVTVSSTNDNIRVELYNRAANYQTKVTVNGSATAMAGADVRYYMTVANESTSAMSNFFLHVKVPTDGLRATTFYTGTYSGSATTYYLEYKTNMNGYRLLASGLNSHSNYSYGMSSQSLGLQSGEYVTDIRMVFSTVVPGMRSSQPASLSAYVLSTVQNGFNAIVRAECGATNGYYGNSSSGGTWGSSTGQTLSPGVHATDNGWVSSSSQFSTYIYGYFQNVVPGELPKTGY